jgi:hypothetical protein
MHGALAHSKFALGHVIVPEYPLTVKVPPAAGQNKLCPPIFTVAPVLLQATTS